MLLFRPIQVLERGIEARFYVFDFCKRMYPKKAHIVYFQMSFFCHLLFKDSSGFRVMDWGEIIVFEFIE